MTKKIVPFGTICISDSSIVKINQALIEKRVSGGKYLREFEDKFANFIGTKHAVAVASGTDALTLALALTKETSNRNKYVVLPALTFIATANAVINSNLTPIFVDVDKYTLTMKVDEWFCSTPELYRSIVIPVHLMGNSVDMDELRSITKSYGDAVIIEDAAEAHGSIYKGQKVGSIGDVGCFSTYLAHIISTIDGGVVTTNNDEYATTLRSLRMHGRNCNCKQCVINTAGSKCEKRFKDGVDQRFLFDRVGFSSRMHELEAAVGIGCLDNADHIISTRRRNYFQLESKLRALPRFFDFFYLMKINENNGSFFSPHAFPIVCNENIPFTRDVFSCFLEENGIETRTLFASIPTQYKAYEFLGYKYGDFPNAEYIGNNGIHIGCHQDLSPEDCDYIVDKVYEFMRGF